MNVPFAVRCEEIQHDRLVDVFAELKIRVLRGQRLRLVSWKMFAEVQAVYSALVGARRRGAVGAAGTVTAR